MACCRDELLERLQVIANPNGNAAGAIPSFPVRFSREVPLMPFFSQRSAR